MVYNIPNVGALELKTIILDLNGTLSIAGTVPSGVKPQLEQIKQLGFEVILFTGNTRGDADQLCGELGIEWELAKTAADKRELARALDPETCASIGNGLIDVELMKAVKLRIVTLQAEGVHVQTLMNSDIVVPNITDALNLFIDEQCLIATLRK